MRHAPPVVCIGGPTSEEKKAFLEKLIAEFKKRSYRVGIIKNHEDEFEIDYAGKDSWRHALAGADAVCVSAPRKIAVIKKNESGLSLEEAFSLMNNVDIIFAEGYKSEKRPRIEVLLPESEPAPGGKTICLVGNPPPQSKIPCFNFNDAGGVVNLLEKMFLPRLVKSGKNGKS